MALILNNVLLHRWGFKQEPRALGHDSMELTDKRRLWPRLSMNHAGDISISVSIGYQQSFSYPLASLTLVTGGNPGG